MERTVEDVRRLAGLCTDLAGEGLYWVPALHILATARPDLLRVHGPPSPLLRCIDVGEWPGIDFDSMLRDLDWSGSVREMVKVAWMLFGGGPVDDSDATEERIVAPRVDDIVCRLDLAHLTAVLEAMRVRKGLYPARVPRLTRAEGPETSRRSRMRTSMIEQAERELEHNREVERIRDGLLERLNALALEIQAVEAAR